jgi:hypothetical protein
LSFFTKLNCENEIQSKNNEFILLILIIIFASNTKRLRLGRKGERRKMELNEMK